MTPKKVTVGSGWPCVGGCFNNQRITANGRTLQVIPAARAPHYRLVKVSIAGQFLWVWQYATVSASSTTTQVRDWYKDFIASPSEHWLSAYLKPQPLTKKDPVRIVE